jgi:YVTN family beta-propeller protein
MKNRSAYRLLAVIVIAFGAITWTVVARSLPPDPNNPTGTHGLIMVDKLGSRVRFVNPDTYEELSNLDVGARPHEMAISPDHKTAYVSVYGDGVYGKNPHPGHTIAVIDLASRSLVKTIDISPYIAPHGIMVDPTGTKLYVTCDLSRKLLIINTKTGATEQGIDTVGTGHWITMLPDGSKVYVANKNESPFVSVIDLKSGKLVAKVPMPNGTQGIVASPDGKHVIAVDFGVPQLVVINTADDTIATKIDLQGNDHAAFRVRYTPDGTRIMTTTETTSRVNIIDPNNLQGPQTVLTVGKSPMGLGFASNGETALVANHGDGTVSVLDLKGDPKIVSNFKAGTGIETIAYY